MPETLIVTGARYDRITVRPPGSGERPCSSCGVTVVLTAKGLAARGATFMCNECAFSAAEDLATRGVEVVGRFAPGALDPADPDHAFADPQWAWRSRKELEARGFTDLSARERQQWFGESQAVCDTCGHTPLPSPAWVYVVSPVLDGEDARWVVCDPCERLIEAGDVDRLLDRFDDVLRDQVATGRRNYIAAIAGTPYGHAAIRAFMARGRSRPARQALPLPAS